MTAARRQRWQQATALVSLSTAGAVTGIAFAHGPLADMTSPASMPAHPLAFKNAARPASAGDGALRSAIVSAAMSYLRLAQGRTPAQMEALIWQDASSDGADHGASCAAFASLTLEAGAQATGQQSWVTGGASYPWPLHEWADVRVDPNPQSPATISILQDAEAHQRWHPLGDGYVPQPGDWVMFAGHVEVVTKYSGGVLYTIGGDSMPNLSVNAHEYGDPLGAQGVTGFVNNGELPGAESPGPTLAARISAPGYERSDVGRADIPGAVVQADGGAAGGLAQQPAPGSPRGDGAGLQPVMLGTAAIPGAQAGTGGSGGPASYRYGRNQVAPSAQAAPDTAVQQAFIGEVAPGAMAAQRDYGVPAAVTIAQAIDESGWGQSQLAAQDNNLFGIKGSGPAGSVLMPTQEFEDGQWVTINAPFRVYNSVAQSISDHTLLLATGSSYKQAMADRADPDAFASDLTGVYATDPTYGASLINIMRMYNLYRYDAGTQAAPHGTAPVGSVLGANAGTDTRQNAADANVAIPGATQGIAGYGPALGAASSVSAGPDPALQSASGRAAAIPGVAASSGAGHGRTRHAGPRPGADATRQLGTAGSRSGSATRGTSGPGGRPGGAAGRTTARAVAGQPGTATSTAAASTAGSARATAAGRSVTSAGHARQGVAAVGQARRSAAGARRGRLTSTATGAASPGPSLRSSATGAAAGGDAGQSRGAQPGGAQPGGAQPGVAQLAGARIPGLVPGSAGAEPQAGGQRSVTSGPRNARISTRRYVTQMPHAVTTAFITTAKTPLLRSEPLYRDVASDTGLSWQLLAACDWMQCRAQPGVSAVYGEKLGTRNADGTVYRTRAAALGQCARDLIVLSSAVYAIDLTERLHMSVRDLAKVFAAFRWGGLLAAHHISALDFPYSVQGLTAEHMKMRWPDVPGAPHTDRPGARFPLAFGAVPVVLGLDYRAVA
ncbi:MAG TPA: glucosaminidase domain-containing protein [Streptosporangiaceae bacterium]|nr:glucosaminidase domain-containing protein [Streptosporangiaceae bacterium]